MADNYIDTLDKNLKLYNSKLNPQDGPHLTYGCRHSNPDGCSKCYTSCCAFTRSDKCCIDPPKPWATRYLKLLNENNNK